MAIRTTECTATVTTARHGSRESVGIVLRGLGKLLSLYVGGYAAFAGTDDDYWTDLSPREISVTDAYIYGF